MRVNDSRLFHLFAISFMAVCAVAQAMPASAVFDNEIKIDGESYQLGMHGVAIDGNLALAAEASNGISNGKAFIFDATTGQTLHELTPSNDSSGFPILFGVSLDISGNLAIVGGATDIGGGYLYDVTTGNELFRLEPNDGGVFGQKVAVDGNMAIVSGNEALYVFDTTTGIQQRKISLGYDVTSLDMEGNLAVVNADDGPKVFDVSTGALVTQLTSAGSGPAVIHGDRILARGGNQIALFDINTGNQLAQYVGIGPSPDDGFGASFALSDNFVVIGAPYDDIPGDPFGEDEGALYVFDTDTGQQLDVLRSSYDLNRAGLGKSVAIEGDTIFAGGPFDWQHTGAAFLFSHDECAVGDANCDGYVDVSGDIFAAFENFTGPGTFNMTRADGDVQSRTKGATDNPYGHDGDVDVSDILAMFSNFTGPAPLDEAGGLVAVEAGDPAIPDLIYDAGTGEVLIDLDGAPNLIGYVLQSDNAFIAGNHTPVLGDVVTSLPFEIAEAALAPTPGPYPRSLGFILPAGLHFSQLSQLLTEATYLTDFGPGNNGNLELRIVDKTVPEPAAVVMGIMALAGLGMLAYRRRRGER